MTSEPAKVDLGLPDPLPVIAHDLALVLAWLLCVGGCTAGVDHVVTASQTKAIVFATITFAHPCGKGFDLQI